jgi:pimeloyl-ACP methyl ester carboxylesterase
MSGATGAAPQAAGAPVAEAEVRVMKKQVGEMAIAYDVRGEGPALVLVHAFPFDRRMWSENVAALAVQRRVIALDLRGFGETAPSERPPSLEDLADDVAGLLDALGIPMASVAGLSMGGYVALAFARRHAARLAALILADTRAAADSPEARQARADGIAKLRAGGSAEFLEGIPFRLLSRHANEDLRRRVRSLAEQRPAAMIAALSAMRDRPDRSDELAEIACPTLILAGGEDTLTPAAEMRSMARAIPGAEFAELAGVGHLANLEAPDRFNDAVARFLTANSL